MNPSVDLIIMSRADTPKLAEMTQHAIVTAVAGAKGYAITTIVVEQTDQTYAGAVAIHRPGEFNYNASANWGISCGASPYVVVSNNDVTFCDGWLKALMDAHYPLVSPIDPRYPKQRGMARNETGWQVGRHLSGWCFMLTRELWTRMGGFDERVLFWCSDDAVVEQARALGVAPMAVTNALVMHHISATLHRQSADSRDKLMWEQVHIFNRLYGLQHGVDNPRYQQWLAQQEVS